MDVSGFHPFMGSGGRQAWDRPTVYAHGPTGNAIIMGGLTHVAFGERCA